MQAWKIYYGDVKNLDKRYVVGIVSKTKDDALACLKKHNKFEFSIEKMEFLGDVHALSPMCEQLVAQKVNREAATAKRVQDQMVQKLAEQSAPPTSILQEDDATEEVESVRNEIECQWCGQVCRGMQALKYHENRCQKNPDSIKKDKKAPKKDKK